MTRAPISGFGFTLVIPLLLSWGVPLFTVLGGTGQAEVSTPSAAGCGSWAVMSLLVAAGTPLGCLVAGASGLYLLELMPTSARWKWLAVLCVPLAIPPYLLGLAWAPLLSPVGLVVQPVGGGCALPTTRSVLSVIAILTASYYPIALLALRSARSAWHATYDEAMAVSGLSHMERLRLRASWYLAPVAGAFAMVALLVLGEFAVADYYGVRTLAAGIFAAFATYQNVHAVTSLLVPLMAAAVLLAVLASAAFRRTQMRLAVNRDTETVARAERANHSTRSGKSGHLATAGLLGFILVTLVIPVYLLVDSLGFAGQSAAASLAAVWSVARSDLITSIWIAGVVSALTLPIAFGIALSDTCARSAWDQLPRVIAWAAFLTPPSLWGLGALVVQSELPPGTRITDSAAVLIIGMILRSLALGTEIIVARMTRLPRSYLEAAAVSGLTRWQALRVGLWKPIRAACGSALVLIWVWSLGEITLTVLVAPAGTSTLMLRIFQSVHYGPPQWLAALTVWHLAMTATGIVGALALLRVSRSQRQLPLSTLIDRDPHAAAG